MTAQVLHASCVAWAGRAALILGRSGAGLGVYGRSAAGLYLRVAVILVLMREEVDPGRMLVIVFARLNGPDEGFSGLSFLFETLHTR